MAYSPRYCISMYIPVLPILCCRYGIQSPVYFKDKSGRLVISPKVDDPDTLYWTEGKYQTTL